MKTQKLIDHKSLIRDIRSPPFRDCVSSLLSRLIIPCVFNYQYFPYRALCRLFRMFKPVKPPPQTPRQQALWQISTLLASVELVQSQKICRQT